MIYAGIAVLKDSTYFLPQRHKNYNFIYLVSLSLDCKAEIKNKQTPQNNYHVDIILDDLPIK